MHPLHVIHTSEVLSATLTDMLNLVTLVKFIHQIASIWLSLSYVLCPTLSNTSFIFGKVRVQNPLDRV